MAPHRHVLLIPGLFSPRWHMLGLRRGLERHGLRASVWDDANVFGDLDRSIERLRGAIAAQDPEIGVVTHSFGDWLFRQAVADGAGPVTSLVSLVPVMAASPVAGLIRPLGRIVPELAIMAREAAAARAPGTPAGIRRLVVWARFDPWVTRRDVAHLENTDRVVVAGSHNTILWQPRVHRLAAEHLVG